VNVSRPRQWPERQKRTSATIDDFDQPSRVRQTRIVPIHRLRNQILVSLPIFDLPTNQLGYRQCSTPPRCHAILHPITLWLSAPLALPSPATAARMGEVAGTRGAPLPESLPMATEVPNLAYSAGLRLSRPSHSLSLPLGLRRRGVGAPAPANHRNAGRSSVSAAVSRSRSETVVDLAAGGLGLISRVAGAGRGW